MNKAVIEISRQLLCERLGLPDGMQILDIKPDDDLRSDSILVKVQDDRLPANSEGARLPSLAIDEFEGSRWAMLCRSAQLPTAPVQPRFIVTQPANYEAARKILEST